MKKNLIFAVLSLMTSCGYYPQMVDIPLIKEKNDVRIDAGVSLARSAHATISYGLTDILAIQVGGNVSATWANHRTGYHIQGATGLFKNYPNNHIMELYAGFGYGYYLDYANPIEIIGISDVGIYDDFLSGNYQQYFVQFNYGIHKEKVEYGIGIKTGCLYSTFTDRNYYNDYSETSVFPINKDWSLLVEPILFIRPGSKNLRFDLKLGGCWLEKITHSDKKIPYVPFNIGIGVNYRF